MLVAAVVVAVVVFLIPYIPGLLEAFFISSALLVLVLLLLLLLLPSVMWVGSLATGGGGGPAGSTERGLGRINGLVGPRGFVEPSIPLLLLLLWAVAPPLGGGKKGEANDRGDKLLLLLLLLVRLSAPTNLKLEAGDDITMPLPLILFPLLDSSPASLPLPFPPPLKRAANARTAEDER